MSKQSITLRDIVDKTGDCVIEYRTWTPDGTDVLSGFCKYINGELKPLDGDTYSLDDEFVKYEVSMTTRAVAVWYESKWIEG